MPFNVDRFENTSFKPREKEIRLDSLQSFFDEGEDPVFVVRGLSSNELHRAVNASQVQNNIASVVKAIAEGGDQVEAVRKALGITDNTPSEVVKRIEMLSAGLVSPEISQTAIVKFAENFPIEFMQLTNEITELTGLGAEEVKPGAVSQKTPS